MPSPDRKPALTYEQIYQGMYNSYNTTSHLLARVQGRELVTVSR
jgi:hypothetical protein